MSWQLALLDLVLRVTEKRHLARETSFERARARMEQQSARTFVVPPGMTRRAETLVADARILPALRVDGAAGPGAPLLLWFHGGAYCLGSPRTHAALAATLARRIGADALLPDYRLAPEHPFPAAPEDALTAWRGLLAAGQDPSRVAIGGDSAGGGLALGLLHQIGARGLPRPACAVIFCPWADMTLAGASLVSLARRDAMLPAARITEIRDAYMAGADPADPRASPVFGDFAGSPPVMIQASRHEILRDDAIRMAGRLSGQGVEVAFDLQPKVPHAVQLFHGRVPEADAALDRAAAFLRRHLPA
jgi:epsilon-lactone hydrolase